jgi:hypothetical protein
MNFGFDRLLGANIHLDLLGLGFGLLGKLNLQHALVIMGAHLPGIDGTGQRERPGEASVLMQEKCGFVRRLIVRCLPLPLNGEKRQMARG